MLSEIERLNSGWYDKLLDATLVHHVQRRVLKQALEALVNLQPIIANGLLTRQQLAFIDPSLDIAITAIQEALK